MNKEDIRIVFMGTPEIACGIAGALMENGYNIVLGVCQPDKPVGRKQILTAPPVKDVLSLREIPVYQPNSLKTEEAYEHIVFFKPDLIVTCAYGKILPKNILDIPKYGCLNVHASLLPARRGSAPIQRAILDGDEVTGITIMKMDEGMDTGDILAVREVPIGDDMHSSELFEIMGRTGAGLLLETIMPYINGDITPVKQDSDKATYCPPITSGEGAIDWTRSAFLIHRQVHALSTWPGAYTFFGGKKIKIYDTSLVSDDEGLSGEPGEVVKAHKKDLWIATGDGIIAVNVLQPEGGKRLNAIDCAHNYRAGQRFGGI
ncbi:methionyl-tRNA formyltransferase [Ruminococcaceae bacterium YRB3002]|nr:methionyl-tRNA formyltransferase [Ruminococcaceae bacterium YRB3002]